MNIVEKEKKGKSLTLSKKRKMADGEENSLKKTFKKANTGGSGGVTGARSKGILKTCTTTGPITASPAKRTKLTTESTDTKTTDEKHAAGGKSTVISSSALSMYVKSTLGGSSSSRTQKEMKEDLALRETSVKKKGLPTKTPGNYKGQVKGQFNQKQDSRGRASKDTRLQEKLHSQVLKAKDQLHKRTFKNTERPGDKNQATRKTHFSGASADTDDVELPTVSQAVSLGLPLLNDLGPEVTKKKAATPSSHLSMTSQETPVKSLATKTLSTATSSITEKSVSKSANKPGDTDKMNLMDKPTMNEILSHGRLPLQQMRHQYPSTSDRVQQSGHPLAKLPGQSPAAQTAAKPLPATLTDKPKVIVWEECLNVFLNWQPEWLDKADPEENKGQPPPVAGGWLGQPKTQIFPLVERYYSYEDYSEKFMLPLLLYETWGQCLKDYLSKREKRGIFINLVMISNIAAPEERLQKFNMQGLTSRAARSKGEVVSNSDLVWLSLSVECPKKGTSTVQEVMGVVDNVKYMEDSAVIESLCTQHKQLAVARSRDTIVQSISIRLRKSSLVPVKTGLNKLRVVCSLVTTERAVQALRRLPENPLWKHLLFPTCNSTYFHQNRPGASTAKEPYNPSQLQAICRARSMLKQEGGTKPQLALIQGPPGTGKSHTIIGIVNSIIKDLEGHVRVCLCTPSNAAVDELVRRLARSNSVTDDQVKVIRLRNKTKLPADLQANSLEVAVKQVWREENIPVSLCKQLESFDQQIRTYNNKMDATNDENQKAKFTADIQQIKKKKEDITKRLQEPAGLATNMRYCLKALEQAHVVAGTLTSMADPYLRQLYRELNSAKKGPLFHCVIIDEAHQGRELDTLIPLQYGTPKLIMVGDPKQLAPTVVSQTCQECRFNLSLFERLDSYFRTSATQSPVLLLDTQYRMHPEIALHPNQYTYEGQIQNDRSLYSHCKYPLVPYLVFNIEGAQASKSMSNKEETTFTAALCEIAIKHGKVRPSAIGIIAPDSNQKMDIHRELSKRRLDQVKVSTVDGFQGQEREVIIMSCVRSREGVGFVGNRNRITVAITRAKHAMYIIGNLDCLKVNIEWRALIENAKVRNLVVSVTERTWQSALEKCLSK